MKAIVKTSGGLAILIGIALLFSGLVETDGGEFPLGRLIYLVIGLALIGLGILVIGLPKLPELEPEDDHGDSEHDDASRPSTAEEIAAWNKIWESPEFVGALRAEGVPLSAIQSVTEEDLRYPGPDFMVSPGAMYVADWETYDLLDEMPEEDLEKLGFFDDTPPHGLAHLAAPLGEAEDPDEDQPTVEIADRKTRKAVCSCRWVWTLGRDPEPEVANSWTKTTSANGSGKWASLGALHRMYDSWTNNCPGADGSSTNKAGWMMITSKVVCSPKGCCAPKGKTKAVSDYRSKVSANSNSGFCFWLSTFGNGLGADGVQLFVDGALVPGGSGSVMATSGTTVIASLTVGIGAEASAAPTGATLSGSGQMSMSVSKTKADGRITDFLNKFGSKNSTNPGMVAELQSGAKTGANVHRKANGLGEQITNVAGLGQIGVETSCKAGTFWVYNVLNTNGPVGRAGKAAFVKRFKLIRDQFLP